MMIDYGDNIHTIRIKATVMKSIAVALVVFAIVTLVIFPTIVGFVYGLDDAVNGFLVAFMLNAVVVVFGGMFISDLPEALGKIREYEEREAQAKQREAEAVLRDFESRRNNH